MRFLLMGIVFMVMIAMQPYVLDFVETVQQRVLDNGDGVLALHQIDFFFFSVFCIPQVEYYL